MDRFFKQSDIFPSQLWREVGSINKESNQVFELFRGHFGGGGVSSLTERPLNYFTLLRDPYALSVSTFQFIKREKNTLAHDVVSQDDFDLEAFVTDSKTCHLINNRMVRNLSFDFIEDPSAQEVFLSEETITSLKPLLAESQKALSPEQRYQRAISFIDNCVWFGLVEHFDRSMDMLCHYFKTPSLGKSQKLNTKPIALDISEKAHRRIEILNAWDIKLYRYATAVFEKRYQDMLHDLESFRSHPSQHIDDLLDKQYQQHQKYPKRTAYELTFDKKMVGSQWHRRELLAEDGSYFRWTGPEAVSTVDLWVKPSDCRLQMRVINALSPEDLDMMELSINGKQVEWSSDAEGVVRLVTANVPKSHIKPNGLARVKISLPKTQSHQEAFQSDDERLVGVAVHWLKFMT
ncbi:hypothetical protein [Marinicella rhabdoformis]|uniref:hypothetical protein n=1 Tax=Marinicella rhabdoformis TaxID=2580566 RepID=UPI001FEC41FD|nr:hypothetical protein [Marinicella rhabdoformis]